MRRPRLPWLAGRVAGAALAMLLVVVPGAGQVAAAGEPERAPVIVTSVEPLADLIRQVAAGRAEVIQMVPSGTSSHGFEPSPRQVRALEAADAVILNGASLEPGIERMARQVVRPGTPVVLLAELTVPREEWIVDPLYGEDPNPHFWMDVEYARGYAGAIAQVLGDIDPAGAAHYEAARQQFDTVLRGLQADIEKAVATIPPGHRKLLSYHDCCPYLARRNGLARVAVVQPSDLSRPSPREVAAIIEQIRDEGLPAVFGSESFPSSVLEQIAAEAGAAVVLGLEDDTLPGKPGDPEHSYVGMMRANWRLIVAALGGDPRALDEERRPDDGGSGSR